MPQDADLNGAVRAFIRNEIIAWLVRDEIKLLAVSGLTDADKATIVKTLQAELAKP